jgi:hypothetical protein
MATVLEERMPMIHDYLVEQYGRFSQSAVDAVSQGLKTAISLGIGSNKETAINFETQTPGVPDSSMLGSVIGTKISEAASVPSPEQLFQPEFKGIEKAQNAELTTLAKNVDGSLKSFQERGIIIICKPGESSAARGIIIDFRSQSEGGIVAPEYFPAETIRNGDTSTLNAMEETLKKTLALQKNFHPFNLPVKA